MEAVFTLKPTSIIEGLINKIILLFATVVTTVGKAWVVDKLDTTVATKPEYIGWGTGAGTAAVADTTLFTEDSGGSPAYARVQGTLTQPAADTLRCVGTLTSNGTKTITNAGTFTAVTVGTLVVHGDFTGVVMALNDAITFTVDIQIT